jgi:hypothetical protein
LISSNAGGSTALEARCEIANLADVTEFESYMARRKAANEKKAALEVE